MQALVSLSATGLDPWTVVKDASGVVQGVMGLLVAMSIGCWYIIGHKFMVMRRAHRESESFLAAFWKTQDIQQIQRVAQRLAASPVAAMFLAGYTELAKVTSGGNSSDRDSDLDAVQRALHRAKTSERTRLESMIPFLATTGSAAPFIGLFGTVWGIMITFWEISEKQTTTLPVVAQPMGEALLATAIGLVAAIPAVMAYNYFQRRLRLSVSRMETFEQDYLNIIRRHFLK